LMNTIIDKFIIYSSNKEKLNFYIMKKHKIYYFFAIITAQKNKFKFKLINQIYDKALHHSKTTSYSHSNSLHV
jgi:hypothetical protein